MLAALSKLSPAGRVAVNGYDLFNDPALPAAVAEAKKGRLEPGRRLLADASADYELRGARLRRLSEAAIPHIPALSALHKDSPDDADIALWLGAAHIDHGWQVRGAKLARYTDQRKFEDFWVILGSAYDPLARAAELRPDDPVPWDRMQWHGLGSQRPRADLDEIWTELKRRAPDYFEGHASRIQVLCEKWQGSNQEVRDFAIQAAAEAPEGSPMPALLVSMGIEVSLEEDMHASRYFRQEAVQERLATYADAWHANPSPSVRTAEAHHHFGAAFYQSGDWLRARRHLSQLSPSSIPRTLPWLRLSLKPAAYYLRARKDVGVKKNTIFDPGPLPLVPDNPQRPALA